MSALGFRKAIRSRELIRRSGINLLVEGLLCLLKVKAAPGETIDVWITLAVRLADRVRLFDVLGLRQDLVGGGFSGQVAATAPNSDATTHPATISREILPMPAYDRARSRWSIRIALSRQILFTCSCVRSFMSSSATFLVCGHVESLWG